MPRARLPVIERSGRPELAPVEDATERAMAAMYQDLRGTEEGLARYSATDDADWSGNAPTTIAAALDRIAAALGPIP